MNTRTAVTVWDLPKTPGPSVLFPCAPSGARPHRYLPAAKTKTKRDRVVPVSTRLMAILEMRRKDPAGEDLPPDAYVFGNALGQRTASIKTAWTLACKRAGLVDFHFHDLRREAGSRWIEGGMVLHEVRDFLGHTRVSQTDTLPRDERRSSP